MVIMINSRIINKIEQHSLIDLELRFFRFLHFNGEKDEEVSTIWETLLKLLKNLNQIIWTKKKRKL